MIPDNEKGSYQAKRSLI